MNRIFEDRYFGYKIYNNDIIIDHLNCRKNKITCQKVIDDLI